VFERRAGMIVKWKGCVRREDALRDLGVYERELGPPAPSARAELGASEPEVAERLES
jgi:hypothetical protein